MRAPDKHSRHMARGREEVRSAVWIASAERMCETCSGWRLAEGQGLGSVCVDCGRQRAVASRALAVRFDSWQEIPAFTTSWLQSSWGCPWWPF